MEKTPTVLIKGQDGKPLRINESDFDKDKHKLMKNDSAAEAAGETVETDTFDREAAKKRLEEAGIKFSKNAKNEKLQELLTELDARHAKKQFSVEPKDDKFIVVDAEGKQFGEENYETEDDAKAMISLLKGE